MGYAKHVDGKGRIKGSASPCVARFAEQGVDEFLADEHAAEAYQARRRDVERLLDMLREEVAHHAELAAKEPDNWGCVGDLGHTRELLVEVMSFLAEQAPEDIERRLAE